MDNKVKIICCVNGKDEPKDLSLLLSLSESWEQSLYKISLKLDKSMSAKSVVYNELGIRVQSVSDIEDGDKVFYAADGEPFIPPTTSASSRSAAGSGLSSSSRPTDIVSSTSSAIRPSKPPADPLAQPKPAPLPSSSITTPPPALSPTKEVAVTMGGNKEPEQPVSYVIRYIIVGNMSVGKSCLLLQFINKRFNSTQGPTIGVDFGSATVNVESTLVKLHIWDTAGQEDFKAITRAYYRQSAVAILVYDVSNRASYEKLHSWLETVHANSTNPNIVITLVGNKMDMPPEMRAVTTEEGQAFAKENGLFFLETSAKTGHNVDNVFTESAREVMRRLNSGQISVNEMDAFGVKRGEGAAKSGNAIQVVSNNNANGGRKKECCKK